MDLVTIGDDGLFIAGDAEADRGKGNGESIVFSLCGVVFGGKGDAVLSSVMRAELSVNLLIDCFIASSSCALFAIRRL